MDKYKLLITLILNQDTRDTYMAVEDDYCYIDLKELIPNQDGYYDCFSVKISDDKVYIRNILDKDFTKVQAKELKKLISEKSEEKDNMILKETWNRLGMFY